MRVNSNRIRKAIIGPLVHLEAGAPEGADAHAVIQSNKVLELIPKDRIAVFFTPAELKALQMVAENGWGDGDFAEWLGNAAQARSCANAMEKIGAAAHGL